MSHRLLFTHLMISVYNQIWNFAHWVKSITHHMLGCSAFPDEITHISPIFSLQLKS